MVALHGNRANGLSGATLRDRNSKAERAIRIGHLFLFIGADPNAAWLGNRVGVDAKGFVITGSEFASSDHLFNRAALPLETSVPGVFAIGDVRAGSIKRVAAAVGEGAAVVAQIHAALAS
jgi:thioredoxin reductase (NADPH)